MPAKDLYHDTVVQALINDGWEITDDPLLLSYGGRDLYVDLAAERTTIAAQKDHFKIAVEIKSFLKPSPVRDLEEAAGQYGVYQSILAEIGNNFNILNGINKGNNLFHSFSNLSVPTGAWATDVKFAKFPNIRRRRDEILTGTTWVYAKLTSWED